MKKVLKLKNLFLYPIFDRTDANKTIAPTLQDWLMEQNLHGQASRSRIRFIRQIRDRIEEVMGEKTRLLEQYSKNKKGKVVYVTEKGGETTEKPAQGVEYRYNVKGKNIEKFIEDWQNYLQEDYLIDVTEGNKDIINGVKDILLNTTDEFKGEEAVRHDLMCQAFEEVWKKDGSKK